MKKNKKQQPAILIYHQSGLLGIALVLSMIFLVSCSSMPVRKSILVEDAQISYVFAENSGPTVVFEAGGGETLETWKPVFKDVAEYTTAVAYTRNTKVKAGDKTTGEDVAYTLKALLEKIKAPKPYVLVGHSLGGMYVRCFAKLFPENVAGVVLVDSVPKGFRKEAQRLNVDCFPASIAHFPPHLQAMARGWDETDEQLPTPAELRDMPITVIVADSHGSGTERLNESFLRLQKEFIDVLPNGRLVEAHGSNHYVHQDKPKIVLNEIQLMVNKVSPKINPEAK